MGCSTRQQTINAAQVLLDGPETLESETLESAPRRVVLLETGSAEHGRSRQGRASGETPSRSATGSLLSLISQELRVALIVAHGITNREAAAPLFVSPKTVEFHLGNPYRKLGVRSRADSSVELMA